MSTIVAISTSPGIGGIGIIRISGKESFKIIEKIFKMKNPKNIDEIPGYSMKFGNIINPKNNEIIDEVLVSYFKSPRSYTTENMCEINSHGGIIVMRQILELCLENGAILAEPGEFTKRAFLNGRIDLVKAEATIDIINAKTEKEKRAIMGQLSGVLSEKIYNIKKKILSIMAEIEANIDYPEYDIEEVSNKNIEEFLKDVEEDLKSMEQSFENGKILKEGVNTAIIGKPNVGKSSLLNVLLKEERAIVTSQEGTTRDTIEEYISISGIPIKIVDTAGIRQTENEVEKIGIDKSLKAIENADLIIAMFDISNELNEEDLNILKMIKNKNAIILLNKIDINKKEKIDERITNIGKEIIKISTVTQEGIDVLYNKIENMYNSDIISIEAENIITNERHKYQIRRALECVEKAKVELDKKVPADIISVYIKEILDALLEITGENVSENIINEIFSKFCLGK